MGISTLTERVRTSVVGFLDAIDEKGGTASERYVALHSIAQGNIGCFIKPSEAKKRIMDIAERVDQGLELVQVFQHYAPQNVMAIMQRYHNIMFPHHVQNPLISESGLKATERSFMIGSSVSDKGEEGTCQYFMIGTIALKDGQHSEHFDMTLRAMQTPALVGGIYYEREPAVILGISRKGRDNRLHGFSPSQSQLIQRVDKEHGFADARVFPEGLHERTYDAYFAAGRKFFRMEVVHPDVAQMAQMIYSELKLRPAVQTQQRTETPPQR